MAMTAYKTLLLISLVVCFSINNVSSLYHICAIFEPQTEHYYEYGNYFLMRTFTDVLKSGTTTGQTDTFDRFNSHYRLDTSFKYSAIFEDDNQVPYRYNANLKPIDNAYMNYCLGINRIPKKHSYYIVWQSEIDSRCVNVYNWNIKYFNCLEKAEEFSTYLGSAKPHYFYKPKPAGNVESINIEANYVGTFTELMRKFFKLDNVINQSPNCYTSG